MASPETIEHISTFSLVRSNQSTGRFETVYNFRVAELHTYFVGSPDWNACLWVHNTYSGPRSPLEGTMPWTGTFTTKAWNGKFGTFRYGAPRHGYSVSTTLGRDGTLHINHVVATNSKLIQKRGIDGGGLLDLAFKFHGRQNIKRVSASFGEFELRTGSLGRQTVTYASENWQFYQRHRGKLGDVGALKKSHSVRALLRNGFTDVEITCAGSNFVDFIVK